MPGRRTLVVAGLLAAAVASALVAGFVLWDRAGGASDQPPREASAEIDAEATFSPPVALFGDTVRAHVDIVLDKTRVDPDSVRIAADFAPFEVIGPPERRVQVAGDSAHLRRTFVLRCLTGACVPSREFASFEFERARIAFAAPGEAAAGESSITMPWPLFRIYSRVQAPSSQAVPRSEPWRVDLLSLPAASYRVVPGLLVALLLAGAALAVVVGVVLAYLAWPRRVPAPPPEPEPELSPMPLLTPLEQALVLLEQSIRVDGAADQRRALELVAEELELSEWGDPHLAREARALAWSEGIPRVEETSRLAARVRTVLPREEESAESGDGYEV